MEGWKVVTAEEMARLEKGGDAEKYMEAAGRKIAEAAIHFIERRELSRRVTLLVGKGNNGGDAYAAGLWLLKKGFQVSAYPLFEEVSPLNKKFKEEFRRKKGQFSPKLEGLIIDGLLGTGFQGKLEPKIASVISETNVSGLPILAIDIPSGINGTSGKADRVAIMAQETVCLGLPKIGLFIENGWNHVGKLHLADFGLPEEKIAEAEAIAYLPKRLGLPFIARVRHKYEAGYVVGYAGSKALSGAAKLAGFAALKAGAGIVRVFHPEEIGPAPLELICNDWDLKAWKEALKKASSVFIGPGLGNCEHWLKKHLKEIKLPCVIDADALLAKIPYPKGAVLTPHRGEALRLLGLKAMPREEEFFAKIIRFCAKKQIYMVLKGAPTFIFGLRHKPIIIPRGDPGMASAGVGDVLTGIIASLLAQGCGPYESAILGTTLHAIAGEIAAEELTSYCLTATNLIDFMPDAFRAVEKGFENISI